MHSSRRVIDKVLVAPPSGRFKYYTEVAFLRRNRSFVRPIYWFRVHMSVLQVCKLSRNILTEIALNRFLTSIKYEGVGCNGGPTDKGADKETKRAIIDIVFKRATYKTVKLYTWNRYQWTKIKTRNSKNSWQWGGGMGGGNTKIHTLYLCINNYHVEPKKFYGQINYWLWPCFVLVLCVSLCVCVCFLLCSTRI